MPLIANPVLAKINNYPRQEIKELSGDHRMADKSEIESFHWWKVFCRIAIEVFPFFLEKLRNLIELEDQLPVCRVHGDLGAPNLAQEKDQLWIFDWEESTENGPILTDEIVYELSVNTKNYRRKPKQEWIRFFDRYLRDTLPLKQRDIMAALAFRHSFAPGTSQMYIENWNKLVESKVL